MDDADTNGACRYTNGACRYTNGACRYGGPQRQPLYQQPLRYTYHTTAIEINAPHNRETYHSVSLGQGPDAAIDDKEQPQVAVVLDVECMTRVLGREVVLVVEPTLQQGPEGESEAATGRANEILHHRLAQLAHVLTPHALHAIAFGQCQHIGLVGDDVGEGPELQ